MSSSDRVRDVLLIAFIPFVYNTIIPHIILNIYSSYLIYAILGDDKTISLCYRQEGELSDSEIIANLAQNDKNRKGKP